MRVYQKDHFPLKSIVCTTYYSAVIYCLYDFPLACSVMLEDDKLQDKNALLQQAFIQCMVAK